MSEKDTTECCLYVPEMEKFFKEKRKNDALVWIPVQCSLLFYDELQHLCTPTKYIFVAMLLTCGLRGSNELPFNISYLARMANVNRRSMSKAIDDLLRAKMLIQTERKTERKEKKATAQTDTETAAAVSVDLNSFKTEAVEKSAEILQFSKPGDAPKSQFTLEECLSYVQLCAFKGDDIKNPKGLATSLYQTGKSDAFIRAAMFPEQQQKADLKTYGEPVKFSDEACRVCYGAKMADIDGKGFGRCRHCRNERGIATGLEPLK